MARWPKDNQDALIAFYGHPGPEVESQLISVIPPFRMTFEGRPIKAIKFHRKAAQALSAALREIWDYYGHDQAKIDKLGVSRYDGSYNPRYIRGSTTKWSNHAFGAAIDINAQDNGFNTGHGTMPQPVVDAFKRQGARWGGDYHGRTDPMHFEFCDGGQQVLPPLPPPPPPPIEPPQTDSDQDQAPQPPAPEPIPFPRPAPAPAPTPAPVPDQPVVRWYKKIWPTISSSIVGIIGTIGSALYDYRVAITFGIIALIIFLIVWFTYLRKELEREEGLK